MLTRDDATGSSGFSEPPVDDPRIAVVIPCFKVAQRIMDVIARIGPECSCIYAVDDACPEKSGDIIEARCRDARVQVLRHAVNQGVGAAVITGYRRAIEDGASIIVKIDGDGQMAPELLPSLVAPIVEGQADYTKGNRFWDVSSIGRMPTIRIIGNAALSFMSKMSSGYWDVFDPTNGYTAIHARVASELPLDRISRRFFFESDMLFRLSTIRAVVVDVPMTARYGDEASNLVVARVFGEFLAKHIRNAVKRIFYNYFLRDFTIASLELVVGTMLLAFGTTFGIAHWISSAREGVATSPGTVMLAALPVLVGLQLLLGFVGFDVASVPRRALHPRLARRALMEELASRAARHTGPATVAEEPHVRPDRQNKRETQ